jgi:hypothetical protein
MPSIEFDGSVREFLVQLFEQTKGDPSLQTSMYAIGASLGWERDTASRAAQDLMGLGLVEIRTLSGGISLSAEGVDTVRELRSASSQDTNLSRLGTERLMDKNTCQAVAQVCEGVKAQAGSLGLDFETLSELMADIKTIACQLDSSRPKTAIVRECLRSLEVVLEGFKDNKCLIEIRGLIGD